MYICFLTYQSHPHRCRRCCHTAAAQHGEMPQIQACYIWTFWMRVTLIKGFEYLFVKQFCIWKKKQVHTHTFCLQKLGGSLLPALSEPCLFVHSKTIFGVQVLTSVAVFLNDLIEKLFEVSLSFDESF